MPSLPDSRRLFFLIALACAAAMGFALYLQYVVGLAVCPLCLTQRVFVIGTGAVCFLAGLHNPAALGRRLYAGLALVLTLAGGGFAARHVWLQHLPPDEVPACGPSLEYMLQTLPFSDTLSILLMGDGNCAETVWTLLGFSIPEQTLALFTAMAVSLLFLLVRKP